MNKHFVPDIAKDMRLSDYLLGIFDQIPTKSAVKKAIKKGEVLVNGEPTVTGLWVKQGQTIEYQPKTQINKKIYHHQLQVIYEDGYMAIVLKPAGLPTSGNYFKTLENALPANLSQSNIADALPRPLPVHRLDSDTSGLILAAKTKQAQVQLYKAFEQKEIEKFYMALVVGPTNNEGTITNAIDGKPSVTHYQHLQQIKKNGITISLLKVTPVTGRTHQIRIHLSGLGSPILGDKLYGGNIETVQHKGLYLTANGLVLNHPISGKALTFCIDLPMKFQKILG